MTARETVANLDAKIDSLNILFSNIHREITTLSAQHYDAVRDMICEEKMLSQIIWKINSSRNGKSFELVPIPTSSNKAKEIARLIGDEGHWEFDLVESGCSIRVDDEDVCIRFNSAIVGPKEIIDFIHKNNLTIITDDIDDEIERLNKRIDTLKLLTK